MNKLLAILAIISITASSVNANSIGSDTPCGTPTSRGMNSQDCQYCGSTSDISNLFQPSGSPNCVVKDCSLAPGTNLNGYMCASCNGVSGANQVYSGGQLFEVDTCVASCDPGFQVDSSYNCFSVGGVDVGCGTPSSINSANCNACGPSTTVRNFFKVSATPNCKVIDCTGDPSTNLNGWICKSCNGAILAHPAYSAGKFFSGTSCVASCPIGYAADSSNTCIAINGADVGCGTANSAGAKATDCKGCGANSTIQNLFTPSGTPNCQVTDCTADPGSNLNGWMCKSCNGNTVAHAAYSAGKFFIGTTCVASCPMGYVADKNNVCQAINGANVGCGTANSAGAKATDCKGCGANSTIQNLFTPSGTPNCQVTDCTADPGSNLNGWMCKSCNGATLAHAAYSAGKFFSGTSCVASCPIGYAADQNNVCQATNGADVGCGTANSAGAKATDCKGCGANSTIQNLFTPSGTPNCQVTDCTADPGSNLNGWMCKSCNGNTVAHTAYSAGKLLSGTTCAASCPTGYNADSNNICQADLTSTTGSYLLTLAFTMLLLCLLI
ncbi:immobilization antigen (macronuclear) [Tetrahymena thermophila SB210]|uniref:Immobilization antigen n=1 Tax=Tetrahymena thermophila (strain SB210) TaxID=312017 RepID=Q22YJ2_TETTS|nr:immobilization antigen [Tetrahymena thermophila SB210]EAR90293.1 immobilization antigen [Tetrahymena thermophila SB210]|eukprot:XP_001010538.1 immobilization antigen [Tetrahymena thermophila SB210]